MIAFLITKRERECHLDIGLCIHNDFGVLFEKKSDAKNKSTFLVSDDNALNSVLFVQKGLLTPVYMVSFPKSVLVCCSFELMKVPIVFSCTFGYS